MSSRVRPAAPAFRCRVLLGVLAAGSTAAARPQEPAGGVLHLADALASASVESAEPPASARAEQVWRFDEPRATWRPLPEGTAQYLAPMVLQGLEQGVRLDFGPPREGSEGLCIGGIVAELEASPRKNWIGLSVRARTHSRMAGITVAHNVGEEDALPGPYFFFAGEGLAPVFSDGSVQTYFLPLRPRADGETLKDVALLVGGFGAGSLEVLEIKLVPRGASFLERTGARPVTRDHVTRHSLFAHCPASLKWRLEVPEGGRLDVGFACAAEESVRYRVRVTADAAEPLLLEEAATDADAWLQRSLDLAALAGRDVELCLEAESDVPGAVAVWGAPVLSGSAASLRPNVIFYVIDGGGADLMSLYDYNRRTTPFLERLAREGVTFERAYSNSTWTQSSTASFMTSLHHSVLGGLRRGVHSTPVPARAVTMAEYFRQGGYQTASFTSNPNAGRVIGLERGLDLMRDVDTENHSTSSGELHEWFWRFRRAYPGQPWWVHFQTTDVHEPNHPVPPFAGLFVTKEETRRMHESEGRMWEHAGDLFGTTSIADFYNLALERAGLDRIEFFNTRRGLYDETMAYQDAELARFVKELKAAGEWENTLFVVAADHGHPAGTFARWGRGLFEPQPESWEGALFDSYQTRVPLLFVWPGRLPAGLRVEQAVSMIDVLPTLLELAGLPPPEVLQGRSLVPLWRGEPVPAAPVILDEFRVDEATGELVGNLEMIEGRWGASLEIGPGAGRHAAPVGGRWGAVHPYFPDKPRLLLYDLWSDPFALHAVNAAHPDLVEEFRTRLLSLWEAHRALGQRFTEAADVALSPEQLQQLRELGYIR